MVKEMTYLIPTYEYDSSAYIIVCILLIIIITV